MLGAYMDEKDYKKKIISDMKAIGTYRPEFMKTIDNLAKIYVDMDTAREQFIKSGGSLVVKHTNKSGATNWAKNPFYLVIEGLQNNILQYNRELGLTPAGLRKIKGDVPTDKDKPQGLMAALISLES